MCIYIYTHTGRPRRRQLANLSRALRPSMYFQNFIRIRLWSRALRLGRSTWRLCRRWSGRWDSSPSELQFTRASIIRNHWWECNSQQAIDSIHKFVHRSKHKFVHRSRHVRCSNVRNTFKSRLIPWMNYESQSRQENANLFLTAPAPRNCTNAQKAQRSSNQPHFLLQMRQKS